MKNYHVYILTNKPRGTLYIGITNNINRRMYEHKNGLIDGFTKKYSLKMLVYIEQFQYIEDALSLEERLKGWHRQWKINLIEQKNPAWFDLAENIMKIDKMDPEPRSG